MKSLLRFFRTTLVGGILFLLPIIVVVIIVGKALAIAHKLVDPLAAKIPMESAIGLETPKLLAMALLVLFCFLAGFFAQTKLAQQAVNWLETTVLSNLPGYEFFKGLSENLLAAENQPVYPVVLARVEDCWQIALLMERLEAGHVAVFIPGVPNPQSGSVYFMTEDRIKRVDLPPIPTMKCLKRYGLGANVLLCGKLERHAATAMKRPPVILMLPAIGFLLGLLPLSSWADVLVVTNGERFVGTIIEESANVVFQSEFGGRLVIPFAKIREIQRIPPPATDHGSLITNDVSAASANPPSTLNPQPSTNNLFWKPPGVGTDGSDWVQLKSGEWLKGDLKYIQNKEVEFDSDEMDQQTLKLKDVSQVFTAHRVFTQFADRQPAYGKVVISNELVMVNGDEPLALHRDLLIGITPSGLNGIREWSGSFNLGLSLQSGNNHQTTVTTMGELARRTPNTTLEFDYLGNYSEVNGEQNANNDRVNATYDIRLNKDWFVRPIGLEYYQDPLANIAYRLTGDAGVGYYIFDRTGLEWMVSTGPGYQYTKFSTVETGEEDTATTPAWVLGSKFKQDITSRLTFIQSWQSIFVKKESGQYTHHTVSTLEFEIKRHLNLDVSFVWDYLNSPQVKSDGTVPQKSDTYLTVGLGLRF